MKSVPVSISEPVQFSVVVPMFNAAPTIARTLASVVEQVHPAAEVLVLDDGSSDGSATVVRQHFPDVLLVKQGNVGAGMTRNYGTRLARSPWIAFLDADDVWSPHHLAELATLIGQFPEAGLVSSSHRQVAVGAAVPAWQSQTIVRRRQIDYFRRAAWRIGVVWTSAAAARRDVLLARGGFTADAAGEDLAAWARIALHHDVAVSSRITALYIRTANSAMMTAAAAAPASAGTGAPTPSPSMRVALAALETGDFSCSRESLIRYLDGRHAAGWRTLLAKGDSESARMRLTVLRRPWALRAFPLRFAAWSPPWLGTNLWRLRRGVARFWTRRTA